MATKAICKDFLLEEAQSDWMALTDATRNELFEKWSNYLKLAHTPGQCYVCFDMLDVIKNGGAIDEK